MNKLNYNQFTSLKYLLNLLKTTKTISDYYVDHTTYMDTVESFKRGGVDASWQKLYNVDGIFIDDTASRT